MADRHDVLGADLVALGRTARVPDPDDRLVPAVLARVAAQPPGSRLARRPAPARRPVTVAVSVVVAVLLGALAVPPVRAAVADWFGLGAVLVHLDDDEPGPARGAGPAVPPASGGPSLRQAAEQVAFTPVRPAALGRPDGVEVSADRTVLSLSWDTPDGVVRLDQLDGTLDYLMAKTARDVEFTTVDGDFAIWFDRPHEVVALAPDGSQRRESARLAGNTLIWEGDGVTLRLEGDLPLAEARAVAASAQPVGGNGPAGNR